MRESNMANKQTTRNYGIDLFRFISMLMIVSIHIIQHGGMLDHTQSFTIKGELTWFIYIGVYCSVNCFALISGYLGINSKHKWKNLVNLSVQALFYCFLFTTIYVCILLIKDEPLDFVFLIKSLIPATAGRYWYFSAYFCLFFFMPILDLVINMPKPFLKRAAVLIFVVFCCISQVINRVSNLSYGYSFLWLAILYVVGGYIAKYQPMERLSLGKSILGYLLCIGVTLGSKIFFCSLGRSGQILIAYSSPTLLLAAIFLLNVFVKLKINERCGKVILLFSSTSFGVYLIHCQPIIYDKLLIDAFVKIMDYNVFVVITSIIIIVFAIYLICTLIDYLRKFIFKLLCIDVLIEVTSKILTKTFSFIEGNYDNQ